MVNAPWSSPLDVGLSSPATAADTHPSSQGLLGDQLVEIIMRRQQPEASASAAAASSSGSGSTSPFRRERERLRNIREEAIRLAFDREREAQRVMIDAQRDTIRAGDQVIEALREQVRQMQQRLDHTISMNRTLLEQRRDLLASAVQVVTYPSSDDASNATPQHTTMFSRTVAEEAASLSSLIHMTEQPTPPRPTEVRRIQADIIPHWTEEGRVSWTSAPQQEEDSESIYDDMPPLVMLDGTPAPDTPPARPRELEEEPLLSDPFWQDAPTPRSLSPAPYYRSRAREFQVRVQRYLATGRARRVLEASGNTATGEVHNGEEDIQSMTQWLSLPPRRDPLDPPTDTLQSFRDSLARLPLQPWSTSHSYPLVDTSKTEDEAAAEAVAAAARIAAKPANGGAYNDQMAQYELKYGLVDRDGDKIPLHAARRGSQPRFGFGYDVIGR